MDIEANYILSAIAIGIGATLVMDLWNLFLKRTFSIPSLNYCLLGRWLRHMPGGAFTHPENAKGAHRRSFLIGDPPAVVLDPQCKHARLDRGRHVHSRRPSVAQDIRQGLL